MEPTTDLIILDYWVMVTGPWSVVQTVTAVPLLSTARPSTATGPTFKPQMFAATWAATPISTASLIVTSPTATFTRPSPTVVCAEAGVTGVNRTAAPKASDAAKLFVRVN